MASKKNQYELTYVISGVVKQNQIDDIVRSITQYVEGNGGEIIEVDEWGNQRLAYEIDKKRSGYYVNMYFRAPGDLIPKVERQMQINDDILRYLSLRMDAKMVRHYEKQKKRAARKAEEEAAAAEAEAEAEGEEDDE
ncbi:30S ribosomal protein S6 [Longibacter salinarum]|uniref:Small ribosomal subunit protein bS6 n=1 Tax=Longibacter salinarum TaxID=1850348 RepID=A0A2A8D1Z8_9BACT|nr:30S ribosomal protein S6 [Longibacter salinarum]PEN14843.1 30S ribosomal protein S6 [Longibacter salinarum]